MNESLEQQLRGHAFLKTYADAFLAAGVTAEDLAEFTDATAVQELLGLASKVVCRKIANAIGTIVGDPMPPTDTLVPSVRYNKKPVANGTVDKARSTAAASASEVPLPEGKR